MMVNLKFPSAWPILYSVMIISMMAVARQSAADSGDPTHVEVEPIRLELGPQGKLETVAMTESGELIAAITTLTKKPSAVGSPPSSSDPKFWDYWSEKREIRVVSGDGELIRCIDVGNIVPLQICAAPDGSIYLGGEHRIGRIDQHGKIVENVKITDVIAHTSSDTHVSGIAVSDQHVFFAMGSGRSMRATEDIVRLTHNLRDPKTIVERQFGCCSHIDMAVHGTTLLIAENSRHRVNRFSFDGKLLGRWGERDRTGLEGFAACCNPVNFDMIDGTLVTAESGIGRVKSFDPDGTFKQLIGYVDTTKFDRGSRLAATSCYIPVEVAPDGNRIYVMDVRAGVIRVLQRIKS